MKNEGYVGGSWIWLVIEIHMTPKVRFNTQRI